MIFMMTRRQYFLSRRLVAASAALGADSTFNLNLPASETIMAHWWHTNLAHRSGGSRRRVAGCPSHSPLGERWTSSTQSGQDDCAPRTGVINAP
eukprot:COSAG01_NODE_5428_length_4272_cov_74.475426_3_plen_94_part_00